MLILKELRQSKKLKQAEIAHYLQVSPQCYSSYEQGSREPNIETLIKLADFFDVSLDTLMGRVSSRLSKYQNSYEALSLISQQNMLELIKVFSKVSEKSQLKICGFAEGLLSAESFSQ